MKNVSWKLAKKNFVINLSTNYLFVSSSVDNLDIR